MVFHLTTWLGWLTQPKDLGSSSYHKWQRSGWDRKSDASQDRSWCRNSFGYSPPDGICPGWIWLHWQVYPFRVCCLCSMSLFLRFKLYGLFLLILVLVSREFCIFFAGCISNAPRRTCVYTQQSHLELRAPESRLPEASISVAILVLAGTCGQSDDSARTGQPGLAGLAG